MAGLLAPVPTRGGAPWRSTDSTPGRATGSIGLTSSRWSSLPVSGTKIPSCATSECSTSWVRPA